MNNIIKYVEENIDAINHDKDILEKDIVKLKEKIKEYDLKKQRLNSLECELARDKYIKSFPFKEFKKLVEEIYSEANDSEYHIYNCDIKRYILCTTSIKDQISSIYRSDISYIYLAKSEISDIAKQEVLKNTFAKGKSKLKNYEFDDELIRYHYYTDNDIRYNAVHKLIDKNYNNLFKNGTNYIGLGFYKLKDGYGDDFNDINNKNINLLLHPETLYMNHNYYMDEDYDIALIFDDKYKILEEIKNAIILFQKNKLENNFMDFIPKYKDGLITIDEYRDLEEDEREEIKRYVKKILK